MDVWIRPDRGRAWAALAYVGVRFAVVLYVFLGLWVLTDAGSVGAGMAGTTLFWCVLTFATGVPTALWWWLLPGRVSYVVTDGELRVLRGSRVVRRYSCADITALTLTGRLSWRELIVRNWLSYGVTGWPALRIDLESWTAPRLLVGPRAQPSILL